MNRPKYDVPLFQRSGKELMFLKYVNDLEEYCDDLEARLSNSDFNLQCLDKDILKIENALDKACEFLSRTSDDEGLYRIFEQNGKSKDKWKEWLLKDD